MTDSEFDSVITAVMAAALHVQPSSLDEDFISDVRHFVADELRLFPPDYLDAVVEAIPDFDLVEEGTLSARAAGEVLGEVYISAPDILPIFLRELIEGCCFDLAAIEQG